MDYFINFILLVIIYLFFFYRKWNKASKILLMIKTSMYVYFVLVLFFTLMPFTISFNSTNNLFMETANLIPFRDVRLHYDGAIREVLLNIIMMVPFGFLYPIIKKKGLFMTVFITFFFSLFIELSQLLSVWGNGVSPRIFDVTDLITNTSGGLIGYLVYIVLKPTVFKDINPSH
ncbi:VanZ family protein (plasmid) [Ureibacillus chungkukjangi]|uniref:VanZ family protein n=1 Tax=Ureibacillus chungkukjangi TaxID=1202712 RepID=UPI001931003A|nr:VanZ family protein [Ureibacillus chungkukjangi]MCM3390644.1 VanZ family protein [Ureibacillus chungkukjangi]